MLNWIRGKVSLKKNRFISDGYDLDLSYITDRIVAMGFPASGFESTYRNDLSDVKRFFDERHRDNYFIYNLCSERSYPSSVFNGRVLRIPFEDHNPPSFDQIRQFCVHATDYLHQDPKNIIAVHCKAGKGRTGVMISALLLHLNHVKRSDEEENNMNIFKTAEEALEFYATKRTKNKKGVTIASQRRYIKYYEMYLRNSPDLHLPYTELECTVDKIVFRNVPKAYFTRSLKIRFDFLSKDGNNEIQGTRYVNVQPIKSHQERSLIYENLNERFTGDFKISAVKRNKTAWFMWFNSNFIIGDGPEYRKKDIDKIAKQKEFPDDFIMYVG